MAKKKAAKKKSGSKGALAASVGKGGVNDEVDVLLVQQMLNEHIKKGNVGPLKKLAATGKMNAATIEAIKSFQSIVVGLKKLDGLIEPGKNTEKALAKKSVGGGSATITGKKIPPKAKKVLAEIMKSSGVKSAKVTSVARTAYDQARIMYENLEQHGVKKQRKLYAATGDKVIDVYEENKAKKKAEVIKLMEKKIIALGPSKVSKHCSNDHIVWDVAPSSISNKDAFIKASKAHAKVVKFLEPPDDPAYHLEIKK